MSSVTAEVIQIVSTLALLAFLSQKIDWLEGRIEELEKRK